MRCAGRALAGLALAALVLPAQAVEAGGPAQVRIAFPREDGSLTPYTFRAGYALMSLVYDTLAWRDRSGVARPWLASSIRRGGGGRRVTVRLRHGVRWQDGRRLTARDVVFTYRYVATHPSSRFTPQVQDIASVAAPDDTTVVFTLRRASLGFTDQPLADVPILPQHLWGHLGPGRVAPAGLPVGSGPYRLVAHDPGHRYRFQANRAYFRGVPSVARIEVPIIGRQDASLQALRTRRVDAAPVSLPPGAPPLRIPGVELAAGNSYTGTVLLFDLARPALSRLPVRRAVSEALDLQDIAGRTRGPGRPVPAERGVLSPGSGWAGVRILHRYDPGAARVVFAEQGIGVLRILAAADDAIRLEAARRVVGALRQAGARVQLVVASEAGFDRALGRAGTSATFDAAVVASPALASYDPAFLRAVYGPAGTAPLNDGGYRSARFRRAVDRVASAPTLPERHRAVAAELRVLARELPSVPLFFGGGTFALRPAAYAGWVSVPGTGILDKRSFLDRRGTPGAPPAATASPLDTSGGGGSGVLPAVIVVLALVLAAAAGWRLRPRSRRR